MSATNWDTCPKCFAAAVAERVQQRAAAEASYGKVPPEKYLEAVKQASGETDLGATLREDYQIGITDVGEFYVIYRASCEQCDFAHEFKHEQQLRIA